MTPKRTAGRVSWRIRHLRIRTRQEMQFRAKVSKSEQSRFSNRLQKIFLLEEFYLTSLRPNCYALSMMVSLIKAIQKRGAGSWRIMT